MRAGGRFHDASRRFHHQLLWYVVLLMRLCVSTTSLYSPRKPSHSYAAYVWQCKELTRYVSCLIRIPPQPPRCVLSVHSLNAHHAAYVCLCDTTGAIPQFHTDTLFCWSRRLRRCGVRHDHSAVPGHRLELRQDHLGEAIDRLLAGKENSDVIGCYGPAGSMCTIARNE